MSGQGAPQGKPAAKPSDIIAIICLIAVAGWMAYRFSWFEKCKNYNDEGLIGAYFFLQQGCPKVGPYGPNSNVFLYTVLHPF